MAVLQRRLFACNMPMTLADKCDRALSFVGLLAQTAHTCIMMVFRDSYCIVLSLSLIASLSYMVVQEDKLHTDNSVHSTGW